MMKTPLSLRRAHPRIYPREERKLSARSNGNFATAATKLLRPSHDVALVSSTLTKFTRGHHSLVARYFSIPQKRASNRFMLVLKDRLLVSLVRYLLMCKRELLNAYRVSKLHFVSILYFYLMQATFCEKNMKKTRIESNID